MQSGPTPHADINELLQRMLSTLQSILGDKLVGLFLYGSLGRKITSGPNGRD